VATSTSLNLRAVLKAAVARSGMDVPARVVSGLTSSAKALFVAAAAHAQPHAVVLYVVASDGDIDETVGDVEFFLGALEGLTAGSPTRPVLPFPSHEVDPYRGLSPHVGVTSARARALHAIGRGTARVVVASAAGLLPRVTRPERLLATSIDLRPGELHPELRDAGLVIGERRRHGHLDAAGDRARDLGRRVGGERVEEREDKGSSSHDQNQYESWTAGRLAVVRRRPNRQSCWYTSLTRIRRVRR
jgi:hypothetical protein